MKKYHDEFTTKAMILTAVRWIVLPMLVLCAAMAYSIRSEAGEWFKTIEVKAGIGTELYGCVDYSCDKYDIADGPIGKFSISQSIYSDNKFKIEIEWDHMSGLTEKYYETPIDYIGINLQVEHDWY